MSITVRPFRRDPVTGALEFLEGRPRPPHDELAGTEASRQDLWASDIVRALGCELLPRVVEGPLILEGTALDALEVELTRLRREVRRVAEATEYRWDYVEARLANVQEALRRAREAGGGVLLE